MFFEQLLLHILQKYDGQRTVFSAYHLLKGKKSGQTIQDVGLFQLHPYFNLFPRLTKDTFQQQMQKMEQKGLITITEGEHVQLHEIPTIEFNYLDGWHLRGGEHLFFERLQLIVQTLSNYQQNERRFLPIIRDERTQFFVKNYLKWLNYQDVTQQHLFIHTLEEVIENIFVSEQEKDIFVYRLSGFQQIGWTWQQLAEQVELSELDVQLRYIHMLHSMIYYIEQYEITLLLPLLHQVRVETVLTASTQQTAALLVKGMSLEQIAQVRRLKVSTIEDHVAEIVMNDSTFSIDSFVDPHLHAQIKKVVTQVGRKKLKPIKEAIPEASYFQIRLVLALIGGV